MQGKIILPVALAAAGLLLWGCLSREARMERIARHMIDRYEKNTRDLSVRYNEALWKVMKGGSKEDYEAFVKVGMEQMVTGPGNASREQAALEFYGKKLDLVFEDIEGLETVSTLLRSGEISDESLRRQLELLYLHLLNRQSNVREKEELFRQDLKIMQDFPQFIPFFRGEKVSEGSLYSILYNSVNSDALEEAWSSLMSFGEFAAPELIRSVKLRNSIARQLGYNDYYELAMAFYEQDPDEVSRLFGSFEQETRGLYLKVKNYTDSLIMLRYGISREEIMPWHYQAKFFTHIPVSFTPPEFYSLYEGTDLMAATSGFYSRIGLPVDDIMERSGTDSLGNGVNVSFMMNVDYRGDIRVMVGDAGNPHRNFRFMLHEYAHAVHNKYIDPDIPYLLRMPNLAVAEAVAVLFERRFYDPYLLQQTMGVSDTSINRFIAECRPSDEMNHLVYMRFIYLMSVFERELFRNPDQDLNALWYRLMKEVLLIDCPRRHKYPDWAASRHIFFSHAVVHNYLLADIIASQIQHKVEYDVLREGASFETGIAGHPELGDYFITEIFSNGNCLPWEELIRQATGEEPGIRYYMEQYSHIPF